MNKKISLKSIVNSVSNEKSLSEEIIFDAIKDAILYTTTKKYKMLNIEIMIDKKIGNYQTYAIYDIIENPKYNISIKDSFTKMPIQYATIYNSNAKIGEKIKKEITSINFGRIDAQIAKQIIIQKVKNAEKNTIIQEFEKKIGKLLTGTVRKITKDNLIIDLGSNIEGIIKKKNLIPTDLFKPNDKIKAYLFKVLKENTEPEIQLSRSCNEMLTALLKLEVPEITEELIEIKDTVRDPGLRAKISIKTNSSRIDPIGACVGIRGSRIQTISKELQGEKIDIILWDKDIIKYIINIFSPIEIKSIEMNEKEKIMIITVQKKNLSKIIGKNGQNIKLISKLIKWDLNIKTDDDNK